MPISFAFLFHKREERRTCALEILTQRRVVVV